MGKELLIDRNDTPHQIADTFIELVTEQSFAKASISEVCSRIGISRKTFYRHFPNKQMVMKYIFRGDLGRQLLVAYPDEQLVYLPRDEFRKFYQLPVYARAPMQGRFMDQGLFVSCLIQSMQRHRDYYLKLLDPQEDESFREYFRALYTPLLAEDVKLILDGRYLPAKLIGYLAEYHTMGLLAMLPMQVADNDRFALDGDLNPLLNLTHESLYAVVERHHQDRPPDEESPFYVFDHR